MDVNLASTNISQGINFLKTIAVNQAAEDKITETIKKNDEPAINEVKDMPQLNGNDVKNITQELNKFLQLLNSDLQFAVHEETQQLMVQVVDTRNQRILKEFPPHELLDTIAKIRDYVGILLDKKV